MTAPCLPTIANTGSTARPDGASKRTYGTTCPSPSGSHAAATETPFPRVWPLEADQDRDGRRQASRSSGATSRGSSGASTWAQSMRIGPR